MPELLFEPGWLRLLRECSRIFRRLCEAGSRRGSRPEPSVMRRQMPAARTAHGEAAYRHSGAVDRILFRRVLECFEDIGFARELERVAVASVGMEHEGVCRSEVAGGALPVADELQLGQVVVASVQPDIESSRLFRLSCERRRDHEAVGLDGAIDSGHKSAHHQAGGGQPRFLATRELSGAFYSLLQQGSSDGDFVAAEELVVSQRPMNGFMKDFDVGHKGFQFGVALELASEPGDLHAEIRHAVLKRFSVGVGDGNSRRRGDAVG